jgi:mannose-6-phosphate isomerase-like protein (cupin superfamily)
LRAFPYAGRHSVFGTTDRSEFFHMRQRPLGLVACVSGALVIGFFGGRSLPQAVADSAPLVASSVNVTEMRGDAVGPVLKNGIRQKALVTADGMQMYMQEGSPAKHFHADANEIQYVIEGTGTIWLGDKQVPFKPGDVLVFPKGVAHAGAVVASGTYRALAIKTPPQDPADTHYL